MDKNPTTTSQKPFSFMSFFYPFFVTATAFIPFVFSETRPLEEKFDGKTVWNPMLAEPLAIAIAIVGGILLEMTLFHRFRKPIFVFPGLLSLTFSLNDHYRVLLITGWGVIFIWSILAYIIRFDWGRNDNYYKADIDMYKVMWRQIAGSKSSQPPQEEVKRTQYK